MIILGISVLLLYFILAAQFESLWQPLIVMITLPLGIDRIPPVFVREN
jgi:multidrug efflux pump subunit AcrB